MDLTPAVLVTRSAAAAVLLAATAAATVTACGTERAGPGDAAGPGPSLTSRPSFTPRPKCAQATGAPAAPSSSPSPSSSSPSADGGSPEPPGDAAPHHAENHAYRMQGSLTAERRAQGQASARLIVRELEGAREEGDLGDARVVAALRSLGCGPDHGVYVDRGFYSVHTGVTCVSGRATRDGITAEVHGAYAEPQPGTGPCVENRGGH